MVAVFFLGILEEIIFFIPMSVFFVGAGFFMIDSQLRFFPALFEAIWRIGIPGAFGVVIGGLIVYWLVYWSGKKFIMRFGRHIGLDWGYIERLNKKFQRGRIDEALLVLLRIVPLVPVGLISIFCGLLRIGWKEFAWTTFFGTFLRFTGLALIGWYLGREYIKYAFKFAEMERYFIIGILIVGFIVLVYLYGKRRIA